MAKNPGSFQASLVRSIPGFSDEGEGRSNCAVNAETFFGALADWQNYSKNNFRDPRGPGLFNSGRRLESATRTDVRVTLLPNLSRAAW
jgi:hypothetical protein